MVKAKSRLMPPDDRLRTQLVLASMAIEIRSNVVLTRLVARARQRLRRGGDQVTIAHQIAVDLGYYLMCHQYEMPRAAYDLLAVAYEISTVPIGQATIIALPQRQD